MVEVAVVVRKGQGRGESKGRVIGCGGGVRRPGGGLFTVRFDV